MQRTGDTAIAIVLQNDDAKKAINNIHRIVYYLVTNALKSL